MICKVEFCKNYEKSIANQNDCILQLLDIIKDHCFNFQIELKDQLTTIFELKTENLALNQTINDLTKQVSLNKSTPVKRKKLQTFSFDQPNSTILSTSHIFPRALNFDDKDVTTDDLNLALNFNSDSYDDFASPEKETNTLKTLKNKAKISRTPLSPINNNEESVNVTPVKENLKSKIDEYPVKLTPTNISLYLPRRMTNKNKTGIENKGRKSSKTLTAGKVSKGGKSTPSTFLTSGLTFIQPVKYESNNSLDNSSETIASSQILISKPLIRKDRNNVKINSKMRQSKLQFDRKKIKTNDISHDEIVNVSPGCVLSNAQKVENYLTQKSLGKFSRQHSHDEFLDAFVNKSTTDTSEDHHEIRVQTSGSLYENKSNIKLKSKYLHTKLNCITNRLLPTVTKIQLNETDIEDNLTNMLNLDSTTLTNKAELPKTSCNRKVESPNSDSVFILPSQPDDVIIVDNTEKSCDFNITAADLLEEMAKKDNDMKAKPVESLKNKNSYKTSYTSSAGGTNKFDSKFQKTIGEKITQVNILDYKKNFQDFDENGKNVITNLQANSSITLKNLGHNCDCRHCISYLGYLVAQSMSREEIKIRLKNNSKHAERPLKLHLTPEGFWDPVMRDFPPDDPRNEILIDTRFIDKKSTDDKR